MGNIFSIEKAVFKSVHFMLGCSPGKSPKERFIEEVVYKVCDFLGGKNVSKSHESALFQLAKVMADVVIDSKSGKWVSTLPAGAGKSTLVTILIATAHEHGYKFPACICVENLGEMNATYNSLIEAGVPKADIACTFNPSSLKKRKLEISPTPKVDWANRRVLLCCHSVVDDTREDWKDRIESTWGIRFAFYDEALKRGRLFTFQLKQLEEQLDELSPHLSVTVRNWLTDVLSQLQRAATSTVSIKPCPPSTAAVIKRAKNKWKRDKGRLPDFPAVDAVSMEGIELIHKLIYGCAVILGKLPPLEKALVLDASHTYCPYTKWDADLSLVVAEPFKKYRHVTTIATGRSGSRRRLDDYLDEELKNLTALVNSLKDSGKSVLVVCVKDYESAVTSIGGVQVLTYGLHRGTNDYKDCDVIVLFGSFYPSPIQAASNVLLHGGDPEREDLMEIGWKQALVDAYQAVNRTVMRHCFVDEHGETQAQPQTIYLFENLNKTQQKLWASMLPESIFMREDLAAQVERVLSYLTASTRAKEKKHDIRKATGLRKGDGIPDRQWREICSVVTKRCGWFDKGGVWLISPTPTPTSSY
jgi:hypothetical protein